MTQIRIHHKPLQNKNKFCSAISPAIAKVRSGLLKLSVSFSMAMMMATTAFASTTAPSVSGGSDIWTWLDFALNDVYQKFLSVSTIAACVAASICLIMMNFSTDDRAVATSRAWLKRILISWVILNVLGFIMVYLTNLTNNGSYVPTGGSSSKP